MIRRARWRMILLAFTVGAGTFAALTLPQSSDAGAVPCLHAIQVLPGLCTHGPDARTEQTPAPTPTAAGSVPCDGDGVSGKRVQVIVARASDVPDHSSDALSQVNAWAANIDAAFDDSAAQTGGHRRVRWVQNPDCTIRVENLVLPANADDDFGATIQALESTGHTSPDRKYLTFMDSSVYCGIATILGDDSNSLYNQSNTMTGYSRVDRPCWNGYYASHELGHNMGAVQLSAPRSDGSWHCSTEHDVMCYGGTQTYLCGDSNERLFDCNHDDYFTTGSDPYLDTHWNVAQSGFLVGAPIAPPSPTPSPTKTKSCLIILIRLCR